VAEKVTKVYTEEEARALKIGPGHVQHPDHGKHWDNDGNPITIQQPEAEPVIDEIAAQLPGANVIELLGGVGITGVGSEGKPYEIVFTLDESEGISA